LYFGLAINVWANITTVVGVGEPPLIGPSMPVLFQWLFLFTMMWYSVQSMSGIKHMVIFMTIMVIFSFALAHGQDQLIAENQLERLDFKESIDSYGALFANPNQLGYICVTLAIACLFLSMRASKMGRIVWYGFASALIMLQLSSGSRFAAIIAVIGLSFVALALILQKRGKLFSMTALVLLAVCAAAIIGSEYARGYQLTAHRMTEEGGMTSGARVDVYSVRLFKEFEDTMLIGRGRRARLDYAGITPHNTFIYLHIAFGGPAAWLFLAWMIIMAKRVANFVTRSHFPIEQRLLVVSMFILTLGWELTTNMGFVDVASVLSLATIEQFTDPIASK
jgi:hypothetical protein